ncbi:hypothetical protein ZIOFF_063090 [Zingiber officinale]|uniref:Uncharacterized protein n=1 Tax=Zingiber officinale TaxID=94328 RepID=A0A8J5KFR1_ZINOF|nr:hypothetical protein ZIOFF_063090 [Zingiber officinale]
MAPKGGRGKGKGERKKKDEKASAGFCCSPSVPPLALDVRVNLPDESHVVLKVKGAKLNDSVDVIALKPCTLALVEGN